MLSSSTHAMVALYMGAWIEIVFKGHFITGCFVALYMGAWIEIDKNINTVINTGVALYMGAWIEILNMRPTYCLLKRRTLYGCVD